LAFIYSTNIGTFIQVDGGNYVRSAGTDPVLDAILLLAVGVQGAFKTCHGHVLRAP
jgi:hypothetical protein